VVEQQIDIEILITKFKMHLPAHKGKALPEFQQELFQMFDKSILKFPLSTGMGRTEKIKDIGDLKYLPGIPESGVCIVQLVNQCDIAPPWNLCNGALHYFFISPAVGEFTHIFQVSGRETGHVGELFF